MNTVIPATILAHPVTYRTIVILTLSALLFSLVTLRAQAFHLSSPHSIVNNRATYNVWLPGQLENGPSWITMFEEALDQWNTRVPTITLDRVLSEGPLSSEIDFNSSMLVATWGDVGGSAGIGSEPLWSVRTRNSNYVRNNDGSLKLKHFNQNVGYSTFNEDVFNEKRLPRLQNSWYEATRLKIMVHEVGHNLGLGHSNVPASPMFTAEFNMRYTRARPWTTRIEQDWATLTDPNSPIRLMPSVDDVCAMAYLTNDLSLCKASLGQGRIMHGERLTESNAFFIGYGSTDHGYTNRQSFSPYEPLDIYASVVFDQQDIENSIIQVEEKKTYPSGQMHILARHDLMAENEYYARELVFENGRWVDRWVPVDTDLIENLLAGNVTGRLPMARPIPDPSVPGSLNPESLKISQQIQIAGRMVIPDTGPATQPVPDDALPLPFVENPTFRGNDYGFAGRTLTFIVAYSMDDSPRRLVMPQDPIVIRFTE